MDLYIYIRGIYAKYRRKQQKIIPLLLLFIFLFLFPFLLPSLLLLGLFLLGFHLIRLSRPVISLFHRPSHVHHFIRFQRKRLCQQWNLARGKEERRVLGL